MGSGNALAKRLFASYPEYRVKHLRPDVCKHGAITTELQKVVGESNGLFTLEEAGTSLEGRRISLLMCGKGQTRILFWSQMHGDESTATLALMDIFRFLSRNRSLDDLLTRTTLCFLPMLNPDGAERVQRYSAAGIDINRDARSLSTPEARILRHLQRKFIPQFGFNLHDQELSGVGPTPDVAAIALLAPADHAKRKDSAVRNRAKQVAAYIAASLTPFAAGHVATYDDTYEPRAFGDNMQAWGTSTVLIESGHWPNDPEKNFVRQLNFVALLGAIDAIATRSYRKVRMEHYTNLKKNGKRIYDIVVHGVTLQHESGWKERVDIGLTVDPRLNRSSHLNQRPVVTVREIGDLSGFGSLREVDGNGAAIHSNLIAPEQSIPLQELLDKTHISFG
jgi:hypothetical protein